MTSKCACAGVGDGAGVSYFTGAVTGPVTGAGALTGAIPSSHHNIQPPRPPRPHTCTHYSHLYYNCCCYLSLIY